MAEEHKCMACECPCDTHKEHTHGSARTTCSTCGHAHKDDRSCDCGCK